jgi:parallel beta-helix repeat protein
MKSFYKVSIILILIFACLSTGCTLQSPSPTKQIQSTSQELIPVPVSGPMIISKPGLYQLTNDLIPSSLNISSTQEPACIKIRSSDVIFDGMGHVIDGKNIKTKCEWSNAYNAKICEFTYGIRASISTDNQYKYSNIVVKNVTVTNWTEGFHFAGIKNILLENSVSYGNEYGLHVYFTSNITLHKNTLSNNRGSGIEGSDNEKLTISENTITHNRNFGIILDGVIQSPVMIPVPGPVQFIFGNQLVLTPFSTIKERSTSGGGHVIRQNTISDTRGGGILLKDSEDNLIEQNRILDNQGTGIWLDKIDNTTVDSNTIVNSSSRAIFLNNCGMNLILINNTLLGNNQNVDIYNYDESVPLTIFIGTILVYLFKVLFGTSKIASEVGSSRITKRFFIKFHIVEQKIDSLLRGSRISVLFERTAIVSILSAVILGGVFTYSTSFGFKSEVFLILSAIGGIVVIIPKAVQYLLSKRLGMQAEYRMWWGGILIMIFTTLLLRNVFGQPIRSEIVDEKSFDKKKLGIAMLAGPVVSILLGSVFLLLYLMKGTFASLALLGIEMTLLTALVTFLPISPMEGERVYKWNKMVWALFFLPVLLGYVYLLFRI